MVSDADLLLNSSRASGLVSERAVELKISQDQPGFLAPETGVGGYYFYSDIIRS